MREYASEQIRNVLIAGHGGTGKTTLAEALLFVSGATNRLGAVQEGTTVFDFEDEEKAKGISASLATAPLAWKDTKINILDSPGYADFIGEVQAGLAVADLVCLVVSAVDGVEVQHDLIWHLSEELSVPRLIFVNKLDRERASLETTLAQLHEHFGNGVAPIALPIGSETTFKGLISALANKAYVYTDGKATEQAIPDELMEATQGLRTSALETIVENDESLMERYLADETLSDDEIWAALAIGVRDRTTFPVLCGSASERIGLDLLLDFIKSAGPSPLDRPGMPLDSGERIQDGLNGTPAVYIYKTYADPFVGQVSYVKAARGTIKPDMHLQNMRTNHDERLHHLHTLMGKDHTAVNELIFGDLGAVPKLTDTATGDTLADKSSPIVIAPPKPTKPVLAVAIEPLNRGDEDKLATALHRITAEDATIRFERNPDTHQTLLWGMGETHIQFTLERMHRKFGVEVKTHEPKVAYRETARKASDFEGKHKKQSGGHGQYGVAHIRLEPLGRGGGYEFVNEVVGGSIPRQYIPAVDKGIQDALLKGPLAGFPVVDVRAIVDDGKHHPVDSDENSFKMAGALALRGALSLADPILLVPTVAGGSEACLA